MIFSSLNRAHLSIRVGEIIFLDENGNKLVNISFYKGSVESLRFEDVSSCSQVFYKKAVLTNFITLCRSLFFDKFVGLQS